MKAATFFGGVMADQVTRREAVRFVAADPSRDREIAGPELGGLFAGDRQPSAAEFEAGRIRSLIPFDPTPILRLEPANPFFQIAMEGKMEREPFFELRLGSGVLGEKGGRLRYAAGCYGDDDCQSGQGVGPGISVSSGVVGRQGGESSHVASWREA